MDVIGALIVFLVLMVTFFLFAIGLVVLKLILSIIDWIFGPIRITRK